MKKEGSDSTREGFSGNNNKTPRSRVLSTERLHIESKTIHIDFKENDGGKFLQIAEISNDRKSTVVIPFSGLQPFLEILKKVAEGAAAADVVNE